MNSFRVIEAAAAAALCAAVLCGCGAASEQPETGGSSAFDRYEMPVTQTVPPTEAPTPPPETASPVTEPPATTAAGLSIGIQVGGEKTDPPADKRMETLRAATEKLYYSGIYPNGEECELFDPSDISDVMFALYDVDEDGRQELIIVNSNTYTAGMMELVFDADETGNITEEFGAFPATQFYTGGYVTCEISHNQGHAGRFWPYSLCKYNPATDTYENIAFVDAWDGTFFETGYEGEPFPADADTSGTGIVYYISENGTETGPMDVTEYEAWYNSHMAGRTKISIPFMDITEANIAKVFG